MPRPFSADESALLAAVHAAPRDDAPRLVYADWLDEHGRPEQAESLRLSCEEQRLLREYGPAYQHVKAREPQFTTVRNRLRNLQYELSESDPAWFVETDRHLAVPPGLSDRGKEAARLILDLMADESLVYTGGCRAFYSPDEWRERGEAYGVNNSLLIVAYDGGALTRMFTLDEGEHPAFDRLDRILDQHRLFREQCTHWYSAVCERD